jgi:glutamate synthase (NADPH/NADH) large chain
MIVTKYGMTGLAPGHITVRLRGSAGQSLGAFAVQGLKLEVLGDSNDYVGKGLSGGTIVVRPTTSATFTWSENTIIGNTVLYGATSGKLFAAGQAGERFAVRNSGAVAVIGGTTVILGAVGANFAAGMTGGMAFVYDKDNLLPVRLNGESVIAQRIAVGHYETMLRNLVMEHHRETASPHAEQLLVNWDREVRHFWQIVPKEMLNRLDVPVNRESAAKRA